MPAGLGRLIRLDRCHRAVSELPRGIGPVRHRLLPFSRPESVDGPVARHAEQPGDQPQPLILHGFDSVPGDVKCFHDHRLGLVGVAEHALGYAEEPRRGEFHQFDQRLLVAGQDPLPQAGLANDTQWPGSGGAGFSARCHHPNLSGIWFLPLPESPTTLTRITSSRPPRFSPHAR